MRLFVAVLALSALSANALGADRPNILVVLTDDHSAPHVGCYGNPDIKTPNLDRFATQGMRFDRAYVTCPQCVPSRSSIMSGRAPLDTRMTRFSAPLPREVKVFPELLRADGYYSGVAGRTYHLDGSRLPNETRVVFERHKLQTFPDRLDFVKVGAGNQVMISQFKEFLDQVPDGKPFVLQLCSNDPHRPLDRNAIPTPHDPKALTLPPHYPDTQLVREDFARYYDEIARFDTAFGTVLDELDRRKLSENTLVIFMGDNGCSQLRGKGTLYEFGVHVPLIMRWPGKIKAGSNTTELVSGEDIAPTILEAAGSEIPKEITGRSQLKLLRGEPHQSRDYVFSERGAHGSSLPNSSSGFDIGRCVITPKYKLIYNVLWQLPYTPVDFAGDSFWHELQRMNEEGKVKPELAALYFKPNRPMFELFDLEADPAEMHNLIDSKEAAAIQKELKGALQEWMILQRDFAPLPVPPRNR